MRACASQPASPAARIAVRSPVALLPPRTPPLQGVSQGTIQAASRARSAVNPSLASLQSIAANAVTLAASVPAHRAQFYASHTVLHTQLALLSTQAILSLCDAITDVSNKNITGATAAVAASQSLIDQLFAAERVAEFGTQWHGM